MRCYGLTYPGEVEDMRQQASIAPMHETVRFDAKLGRLEAIVGYPSCRIFGKGLGEVIQHGRLNGF